MDTAIESKVGRRLQGATAPEVCELIYTPRLAREFKASFGLLTDIHQAHLLMLRGCDLVDVDAARRIARALVRIEEEGPDAFELDPMREDAFFNYEARLIALAGPDGGRLHLGRSRNDILATQDRLRARGLALDLVESLADVLDTALAGAERHAGVVMPGYTHMQPAQPITYGFYLTGIAQALQRDAERLARVYEEVNLNPLGACALAGTAFPIDRRATAELLGFAGLVEHALDAVAARDFALEMLAALSICAVTASRVAQDLQIWSTPEYGLIDFPDSVAGTSSIMPQKKNPVVLEHLRGKAGQMVGLFAAAAATVKGVGFSHTGDGNRESLRSFWEAGEESLRSLRLLDLVLRSAQPDAAAGLRRASEDFSCVTDLADAIVRECRLSFREAHHVVGAVVRSALQHGLKAHQIDAAMVDAAAQAQLGRPLGLAPAVLTEALDPRAAVQSRSVPGGPAASALAAVLDRARTRVAALRDTQNARRAVQRSARERLKRETAALAA